MSFVFDTRKYEYENENELFDCCIFMLVSRSFESLFSFKIAFMMRLKIYTGSHATIVWR